MGIKETYTQKEFRWNKKILLICKVITAIAYFWISLLCFLMIKVTSFSVIGIVIASICFYKAFTFIQSLDKQTKLVEDKNNNTWGLGLEAEKSVGKSLRELPPEFKVIEDFDTGHGNIDFVVIGPTGIFAIEVKATRGLLKYDQQLLINGRIPQKDYIYQIEAERLWLIRKIKEDLKKDVHITGLLEFPNATVDRSSIHGPVKSEIWIGEGNFHKYLILKEKNSLLPRDILNISQILSNR